MHVRSLELVDHFARFLSTERRLSPHTTSAYRLDLVALVAFCWRTRLLDWAAVEVKHVRTFAAQSHAGGLSPSSVQRRLSALRTFFRFLLREGVVGANVAELVQAPRAARKLPEVLDAQRMARLLDIPDTRDKAVMELLYSSGLRLAELVSLNVSDLDLMDRIVRAEGKGSKTRLVPVGRIAITAIQQWLRIRKRVAKPGEPALFVGRGGHRLQRRAVQGLVSFWAQHQGINVRVHPHLFRRAAATHLLESSGDIRAVMDFLGHASSSTTQIYTHLDSQRLLEVYSATHPRAHRRPPL